MKRSREHIKPVLVAISALLILSISLTGRGQGAGRPTATPTPKPPISKPSVPSRKPTTPRSTTPAFRPRNPNIELVKISPGSFMMGSTNGDRYGKPVHQVTINYSFYMGKYEVTQKQWQAVMGNNPSYFKECGNCPVEHISWDDAQSFIVKFNQMSEGYTYRLPTEAEWEYACRAGTTGDYAGPLDEMAWYGENAQDHTHPVGLTRPNAWGLADMQGNVAEWCEDWFHTNYDGAPNDGSAWLSGGQQIYRVLRGGTFLDKAQFVTPTDRGYGNPGAPAHKNENLGFGFRVVAVSRTR